MKLYQVDFNTFGVDYVLCADAAEAEKTVITYYGPDTWVTNIKVLAEEAKTKRKPRKKVGTLLFHNSSSKGKGAS